MFGKFNYQKFFYELQEFVIRLLLCVFTLSTACIIIYFILKPILGW